MAYIGNAYSKKYITGDATTLVNTGPCVLHSITINKPTATETIELDDALTQTNPFAIITIPASPMPVTLLYDVICQTGLSITTATATSDITVSYLPL